MEETKLYSKSELIDIINEGNKKGLISIKCSIDQLINITNTDKIKEVSSITDSFDINHGAFFRLLVKRFDFHKFFRCSTIGGLTKNIIELSKDAKLYGYGDDESGINKLKGDLFEIFAELFFKLTTSDNRIGIVDYRPVIDSDDYGVDGVGIAINNAPVTVQVKFRSNVTELLTIKHIKNLQGLSYKKHKVPVESGTNIVIFTNCAGVHWNTETNVMRKSILVYSSFENPSQYNLTKLIDGNNSFWKNLISIIKYNINEITVECTQE